MATKRAKLRGGQSIFTFDNRWVVPYCPALLREFRCHLNMEICATVKAIKYVVKYISKGSDMAAFQLRQELGLDRRQVEPDHKKAGSDRASKETCKKAEPKRDHDEIRDYLVGRYIGPMEAVNTILGFKLHDRSPAVIRLPVHLPGDQLVYFTASTVHVAAAKPKLTKLTAFFDVGIYFIE